MDEKDANTQVKSVPLHARVAAVTKAISDRSRATRQAYLDRLDAQWQANAGDNPRRHLSCGNLAHGLAACNVGDKKALRDTLAPSIAIVSAYNDILSAHQPYEKYPDLIRQAAQQAGAVAQFAGGVPAMCDGVTQGQPGMELSLMSRDVIAMATAVALSHQLFDGALYLGICDKIVPGLLMGALTFAHIPCLFIPAGPMPSGLPNKEKIAVRQAYAEGKADEKALLAAEMGSYHSPGTCTFYGTANTNQVVVEALGLQLCGSSFVVAGSLLRMRVTQYATEQLVKAVKEKKPLHSIGRVVDEKALVNSVVALLATGGSTNLTIHLLAIARAAGFVLTWQDIADLAECVPLLAKIYPNGSEDVNAFHQAGGSAFLFTQLLAAGLMHGDAINALGVPFAEAVAHPQLVMSKAEANESDGEKSSVIWQKPEQDSLNEGVVRTHDNPFQPQGGIKLVTGNLGRGIAKISAVAEEHRVLTASAEVFTDQHDVIDAFKKGLLDRDCVVVLKQQGPRANGMPELHKLMPSLGVLQDRGFKVALVTDGRLSGASGKVPCVIHLVPEAIQAGAIAKIESGDLIQIDLNQGVMNDLHENFEHREAVKVDLPPAFGVGRELFVNSQRQLSAADKGASFLFAEDESDDIG